MSDSLQKRTNNAGRLNVVTPFHHLSGDSHINSSLRAGPLRHLISILLDGNTEAAFGAELVTAGSTKIGMGFVPISIRWQAVNRNLVPGIALRAVLLEGAGNFVRIVAHRSSPPFQAAE